MKCDAAKLLAELEDRAVDFEHYCARLNQLRCMKGIVRPENEDARQAVEDDIAAQLGLLAKDCWCVAGGRS